MDIEQQFDFIELKEVRSSMLSQETKSHDEEIPALRSPYENMEKEYDELFPAKYSV